MSNTTDVQLVRCTGCQTGFKLKSSNIGKQVKCPKCQTVFEAIPVQTRTDASAPTSRPAQPAPRVSQPSAQPAARPQPVDPPATRPGMTRCEYCHEFVADNDYAEHYQSHMGTREDGQLNTYPTLPPEEQWDGDISRIPSHYVHSVCGATTVMPEEIMRTYLVDPYFYAYKSYCAGCEKHVSYKHLKWAETGEGLAPYFRKLQASTPNAKKFRNRIINGFLIAAVVCGIMLGLLVGLIMFFVSGFSTALAAFAIAGLIGSLGSFGAMIAMRGGI